MTIKSNKVTFNKDEVDLMMEALQQDEELLLAARVRKGRQKLKLLEEYLTLSREEDEGQG